MAGSELDGPRRRRRRRCSRAPCGCSRRPTTTADATFSAVAPVVAELGADVVALAAGSPRPGRRRDQPRAAPHRGDADGSRQRARRGARRAAAPGRRRLPRHDPHRLRTSRRSGSTSAPRTARRSCRALDGLIDGLRGMRDGRRRPTTATALHDRLQRARDARANLPSRVNQPSELAEVRIPIPDRPGAAAEIFTLAAELGVNIASFEVVHSVEGNRGVAVVLVDATDGRAVPRRADRARLPAGRAAPRVSAVTLPRRSRSTGPLDRRRATCPDRRASPTGRSSAPRSPTASRMLDGVARRRRHGGDARLPRRCSAPACDPGRTDDIGRGRRAPAASLRAGSARRCTRGWPARPRGSSPRSPRSGPGRTRSTALPPLRDRPMTPLHDALAALGADGRRRRATGGTCRSPSAGRCAAPASVVDPRRRQQPVHHRADADRAVPRRTGCAIELTTPLVSRPYVGITAAVMAAFGVAGVERRRATIVTCRPGRYAARPYRGRARCQLGQLPARRGGDRRRPVHVPGLDRGVAAGRCRASPSCSATMGCDVHRRRRAARPCRATGPLRGIDVDMVDISDLVPTLAVVAPFADTPTDDPRRRLHPRQGERPARRPVRRAAPRRRRRHARPHDGLVVEPGPPHPARARHAPRPPPGDGVRAARPGRRRHRDRRSGRGLEELARATGRCSRSCSDVTDEPSVAAFDVDGTLTDARLRVPVPRARRRLARARRARSLRRPVATVARPRCAATATG